MKKSLKIILGIIAAVLVILVAGGMYFWNLMQAPLYQPGALRSNKNLSASLVPPAQPQSEKDTWLVESGIRLHYFTQGQGKAVLIVHGGPGVPFSAPMTGLQPLADRYRFYYYDQRGCGDSTRPIERFPSQNMYANIQTLDKALGLGAQIADIERIRQILGEDKLILIGHSWGGFLASLYAAEFPEHVQALILVSPATMLVMPQPQGENDLFGSVRARLPDDQVSGYDAFMKEYMNFGSLFQKSEADLVAYQARFGQYYKTAVATDLPEQGKAGGWMVWAQYMSMGQRHDYRPALRPVTVPVLVLHGANDLQTEAGSRQYAEVFPNASFVVIPNAGHFSFEQQPKVFSKAVGDFLNKIQ